MPFALENIGWKTYMINASWDILEVAFVAFYWVETRKKSLEEIDAIFESEVRARHQNVMDGMDVEGVETSSPKFDKSSHVVGSSEAGNEEKVEKSDA